jgi:hypothetical protein
MKEDNQKEFTHVLGMAKSCLNLKGAKSAKVELDFLRLIYCIEKLRKEGQNAYGYLAVVKGLEKNVENWIKKYKIDIYPKYFDIITVELNNVQNENLNTEKENNSKANVRHIDESIDKIFASGIEGERIFEDKLKKEIHKRHVELINIPDNKEMPLKIRWDFYKKY